MDGLESPKNINFFFPLFLKITKRKDPFIINLIIKKGKEKYQKHFRAIGGAHARSTITTFLYFLLDFFFFWV